MSDQPIYPWYATVKGDALEQGDVLPGFEIVVPKAGLRGRWQIDSIGKAWQPSASLSAVQGAPASLRPVLHASRPADRYS